MESAKIAMFVKKKKSQIFKNRGNEAFQNKKFEAAEKFYSEAIDHNPGLITLKLDKPNWTNRAICRNAMKKYADAFHDCDTALSIDSKFSKVSSVKLTIDHSYFLI